MIYTFGIRMGRMEQTRFQRRRFGKRYIHIRLKFFGIRLFGSQILSRHMLSYRGWKQGTWLMVTSDRLIGWGLLVPPNCVLCVAHDESRLLFSLIVPSANRCGLSSLCDSISLLGSCLRTGWDGWKTHQVRMWSWLLGWFIKLPCTPFGRKEIQEFIQMWHVHQGPLLRRLSRLSGSGWIFYHGYSVLPLENLCFYGFKWNEDSFYLYIIKNYKFDIIFF